MTTSCDCNSDIKESRVRYIQNPVLVSGLSCLCNDQPIILICLQKKPVVWLSLYSHFVNISDGVSEIVAIQCTSF